MGIAFGLKLAKISKCIGNIFGAQAFGEIGIEGPGLASSVFTLTGQDGRRFDARAAAMIAPQVRSIFFLRPCHRRE